METLTIEISNPKARRLIDDLVDLGLISVKEEKCSWNERWEEFSKTLPNTESITEEEIFEEIKTIRASSH
jgi:transcription elongation GreA/GreB family factor